jgi:type IV pilus assembly protein PilE
MDKKGFTLIELLIVIAIIAILAGFATAAYIGQQKRAARTEAYTNLENLRLLEEQYFTEYGCYYRTGGPPPVCTNATIDGVTNIRAFLPGFRPGDEAALNFTYSITTNSTGPGGGTASGFTASAAPKSGTRVAGDPTYTINQNNVKTNW